MPELFAKLLDLPLGYFLIVIAAILLLVAGVGKFKGLIDPGKSGRIFSGVIGIPLIIIGLVLSVGFPSVTPGTVRGITQPSSTSSTTPPKTLTVNRQLMCVSDCNTDDPIASHTINVQITVISFTFDTAQEQTSMLVLLEPRHSESGCSFGSGFSMQDATGKTYDPGGQLKNGGSFSLVQGQQQRLVATYAFIPSAGSIYTLHPSAINCDYHSIGYTPTYGDAQFTF